MVTDGIGTRPAFILCSPRSGSTIFFRTLGHHPDLVSLGTESQQIFNSIPALHPSASGWHSGRLTAADATPEVAGALNAAWLEGLESRYGRPLADPIRFLEKTPHTCLKVPFLKACFPNARFIVLYRAPGPAVASLAAGWAKGQEVGRFVTFRDLPGFPFWCFFLPPGWRDLAGQPFMRIAAHQWHVANTTILDDVAALEPDAWTMVSYEEFVARPTETMNQVTRFLGIAPLGDVRLPAGPEPDAWRWAEEELAPLLPGLTPVWERLQTAQRSQSSGHERPRRR
jgi:Sulfotransferase family